MSKQDGQDTGKSIHAWTGNIEWEEILECSKDGIFVTDGRGVAIYANKAYEKMAGLCRSEIEGVSLEDFAGEKNYITNSITLHALRTGHPMTGEQILKRTGKKVVITSNPVFRSEEENEIKMVVSNVRDMSEIESLREKYDEAIRENDRIREELQILHEQMRFGEAYIAKDKAMKKTFRLAKKIAGSDSTVLLTGETGTGKEVMAQYIHENSDRRNERYIKVNCGAISESLVESELFGYERGAFTGASKEGKKGLFEVADRGTLFLDEIGELPLDMQAKLLRVLQEKEITRVGSTEPIPVDVRVIAATNRDLEQMVAEKKFRMDLFYRLSVILIRLPALRDRKDDIFPLAQYFLEQLNAKYGEDKYLLPESLTILEAYRWPGNIRELRNVMERAYIMSASRVLLIHHVLGQQAEAEIAQSAFSEEGGSYNLAAYLRQIEYRFMQEAYQRYGNVREAAAALHMNKSTFAEKMKKYNNQNASEKADKQ